VESARANRKDEGARRDHASLRKDYVQIVGSGNTVDGIIDLNEALSQSMSTVDAVALREASKLSVVTQQKAYTRAQAGCASQS
jgi:hypothetical protein